ncbi:MAG: EthD domain-containing protein [Pseudomonadales bacterium]|nr:EthD domain-containing protein [Pseudomonadales bacterium]MBO6703411.1 EthD domain-containing protein [Pseudomonadales bacterium]MBO7004517.1 EthD domain-containing protein [Pseudomonadales bacterium]
MFKAYFLMSPATGEAAANPYRYEGKGAEQAVKDLFPQVKGYVQTRALPGQEDASFSGTAELWFDRAQDALEASRQNFALMLKDGVDIHSSLAGMERVVVRTPDYLSGSRMKGVYPFCRKEGMALETFQDYWWHHHGPIAALTEEALAYVQIHPLLESYQSSPPAYDGITEISWRDAQAAMRGITSRQMVEDQAKDAPNFVADGSVALYLAQEETVIAP